MTHGLQLSAPMAGTATPEARASARRLRRAKPKALLTLSLALQASGGAIGEAAELVGLAGASSLWRIAYAQPAVREIMRAHARKPWERRKGGDDE